MLVNVLTKKIPISPNGYLLKKVVRRPMPSEVVSAREDPKANRDHGIATKPLKSQAQSLEQSASAAFQHTEQPKRKAGSNPWT